MAKRTVFFATNRTYDPTRNEFTTRPDEPPHRLWAGFVRHAASADPARDGRPDPPQIARREDPEAGLRATLADWLARGDGRVPLLFVHGFALRFPDAVARAGDLAAWLEAAPGAPRFRPLCFSWPSDGITSLSAYRADRIDAEGGAAALAHLVVAIARAAPPPAARPVLIAHSMGVFALRCAVQRLASLLHPLPAGLFRHAFLMAGDDETDVFRRGDGASPSEGGLRPLATLAARTTVGVHRDDGVLWLISRWLNRSRRLGATGPKPAREVPAGVKVVDYSMVATRPDTPIPPDQAEMNWVAHQYYRNNPHVRADMLAAIAAGDGPVAGRRRGRRDPGLASRDRATT